MHYAELDQMTTQLNFDLSGARVEQISDGSNRIQFGFKALNAKEKGRFFVVVDFRATHLDIYATEHPRKAPAVPQAFTMLLRKYLLNETVCAVRIAHDDRIVFFEFGHADAVRHVLIAELTGRNPNIFFIDHETQRILGRIGKSPDRNVNETYTRPANAETMRSINRFADAARSDYYTAVEAMIDERNARESFETSKTDALRRAKKHFARLTKLHASLCGDLAKVKTAQNRRREADLLNAYAWQIKKGDKSASLPDFETGDIVQIALDPSMSVRENIEKRYAQAKRMDKAEPLIRARFEETQSKLDEISKIVDRIESATTVEEIDYALPALDMFCIQNDVPKAGGTATATKSHAKAQHKPFKTFYAADGTPILVGKSAKDNIELTFRYTRGNDTWLHACGATGSHVVVKSPNPTPETILDAALLAMHYSSFARSTGAEIQITQAKYLKKIKSGPIGKVEVHNERTIYIRQDEARIARLNKTLQT